MKQKILLAIACCLILAACNLPRPAAQTDSGPNLLETNVAATLAALTRSAPPQQPLATPTLQAQGTFTPENSETPSFTNTPVTTNTPEPGFGSISGGILNYPYGAIPQITIVAYEQGAPYHYWYWITASGSTSYSMDGYISTGKYQVVAYDPDGHKGGCVTLVEVKKNEMVTCDITDWAGSYRDKPAGVP